MTLNSTEANAVCTVLQWATGLPGPTGPITAEHATQAARLLAGKVNKVLLAGPHPEQLTLTRPRLTAPAHCGTRGPGNLPAPGGCELADAVIRLFSPPDANGEVSRLMAALEQARNYIGAQPCTCAATQAPCPRCATLGRPADSGTGHTAASSEAAEQPYQRTDGPVHGWFGLTYANFLVLHRALLQSMPLWWQAALVELLEDLYTAYHHIEHPDFDVATVRHTYAADLTHTELAALGITHADGDGQDPDTYFDRAGNELPGAGHVSVPSDDPVPHYRHAYVPPDEHAITAARAARAAARP